jgi:hypothetical protein
MMVFAKQAIYNNNPNNGDNLGEMGGGINISY